MNFFKPKELPKIMVAPNGARKTKKDHSNIPVTINELVLDAEDCYNQGAKAIHFHVRDNNQNHVLDAGLYNEALQELSKKLPKMHFQITTESVQKYDPKEMRKVTISVMPPGVSIGIIEMIPDGIITKEVIKFYRMLEENDVRVQHICYKPEQVVLLSELLEKSNISKVNVWCMFTIGHYTGIKSDPNLIQLFLDTAASQKINPDWAVCAFDNEEHACLKKAVSLGGKVRVGFENSMVLPNGGIAKNNSEKVKIASKLF